MITSCTDFMFFALEENVVILTHCPLGCSYVETYKP